MNSCMCEWHDGHQTTTGAARALSLPTVRVAMLLRLVRMPDRVILGERSIAQSLPAEENTVAGVVAAFGRALDAASVELVGWTLQTMSSDAAHIGRRAPAS